MKSPENRRISNYRFLKSSQNALISIPCFLKSPENIRISNLRLLKSPENVLISIPHFLKSLENDRISNRCFLKSSGITGGGSTFRLFSAYFAACIVSGRTSAVKYFSPSRKSLTAAALPNRRVDKAKYTGVSAVPHFPTTAIFLALGNRQPFLPPPSVPLPLPHRYGGTSLFLYWKGKAAALGFH